MSIIDYPKMEELFGSLDYCTCEHCKSALSPAAYLVELLQFIDLQKYDSNGNPKLSLITPNPIAELLKKRPDIEYIQLTCENTNTVLPYIDLVNEILEYYVATKIPANNFQWNQFKGHNVGDITSQELLANPQFVNQSAYNELKNQAYPFNLPFNQPLEALRLCYDYSKVKLYKAMEKLRVNDELDIPTGTPSPPYAWREIYNESLGISQEEYKVLIDSTAHELHVYFGMNLVDFNNSISYAKIFSRKTGITYNELIELTKTRFINTHSFLIQKLEKLTVSFSEIKDFHATPQILSDAKFREKIPSDLRNSPIYGNDALQWVNTNYDRIMSLTPLNINWEAISDCKFDELELLYSSPDTTTNSLMEIDYWRFLRFIRLWKKLGWTIDETDKIITALYVPGTTTDAKTNLDIGFKDLIIKIAHVKKIIEKLNLPRKNLVNLLTVWSDIDTHGDKSLYKKMFLTSMTDTVFYENGSGEYLQDATIKITDHLSSIQAAFNITENDLSLILKDAQLDNSPLLLENVSKIYRYVFLSKALKLSIEEFVTLKTISQITPFNELEDVNPSILTFIELAQLVKQSGFKISALSYFLHHEDVTGKLTPRKDDILSLVKTFKDGLTRIEQEHTIGDDVTGEIAKSQMALIYENSVVDKFFGLLKDTTTYSTTFSQPDEKLKQEILDSSDKISYDHFQKQLTYQGVMTENAKEKFKNISGVSNDFKAAIDKLYTDAQSEFQAFFDKYPELKRLYDNYADDLTAPINDYKAIHTHDLVGNINLTKFPNLIPGHLVKSVNLKIFNAAGNVKVKVYADNEGAPGVLLGTSGLLPMGADPGIQTFVFASPISIPANGIVWTGFECDDNNLDLYNTTGLTSGTGYFAVHDISTADPDPFGGTAQTTAFYTGITTAPPENEKLKTILESFLPALKNKLKHLFIKQTISSSLNIDLMILDELLEKQSSLHCIESDEKQVYWNSVTTGPATMSQNKVLTTYLTDTHGAQLTWLTTSQITVDTANRTITFTESPSPAPPATARTLVLTLDEAKTRVTYAVGGTNYVLYTDGTTNIGIYLGDGMPAIEDFLNLESGGVSAQYFFANDTTGIPDKKEIVSDGINFGNGKKLLPPNPTSTNPISAVWQFYLEVPINGNYNYHVETDAGATVKISVDGKEIPTTNTSGIWQNNDSIELSTGRLYHIKLEIEQVGNKAVLKWASRGIGKDIIPVQYLHPYTSVENFARLYVRLLKAINILANLDPNEKEIAFFNTYFKIDGRGFLNAIPVEQNPNKHKVQALFKVLTDLLRYANLKKSLNVKDEILSTILNDLGVVDKNGDKLLLKLTGWDEPSLDTLLNRFRLVNQAGNPDLTRLGDLNPFLKMYEAFLAVRNFGVSAKQLLGWTTNQPDASTVRDLTIVLRAKYDDSVWLDALRQINDQLRSRQRDALVSYTLHLMQKDAATTSIDTPDKLFEYFLIDVENDPCTKTSRIKQAISTVQLFIQRCLLNLEPPISPHLINADQWEWMQRYRVWEANRKVFLYPENWLEPELRDNKSSFFKDLEGELLQADITNDLAETAFLNYLEKLDDVSKLEISGMYLQEKDLGKKEDDILHVFGRTAGAGGKYYYRRLEYGHWTPWEKVGLDIEDNPILPVVWKSRLFLFWLNIVRKGSGGALPEDAQDPTKNPIQLTISELNSAAKESIEINLSWSEYYNNKWQPRKTSDFNDPIVMPNLKLNSFSRKDITIFSSSFEDNNYDKAHKLYDENSELLIKIYCYVDPIEVEKSFRLFNKHSTPLLEDNVGKTHSDRYFPKINLELHVADKSNPSGKSNKILTKSNGAFSILQEALPFTDPFEAPFFYQDKKHVFFVQPETSDVILPDYQGILTNTFELTPKKPKKPTDWFQQVIDITKYQNAVKSLKRTPQLNPKGPRESEVTLSDSITKIVLDNKTLTFDGVEIWPTGSQYSKPPNKNVVKNNFEVASMMEEKNIG